LKASFCQIDRGPVSASTGGNIGPTPGGALELLAALLAEVRGLRSDLRRERPAPSLTREDRDRLARILPAVAGAVGSELFNSAELCEHDAAAVRLVCAGVSAKQLGRLLRRAVDTPISGYVVRRQGTEAGAVLWQILQVPDFPGNEKVSVPPAGKATGRP
jgi:hypothetical protein